MTRLSLRFLLIFVCSVWFAFFILALVLCGHRESFGQLGDTFGVLNSLFSGLAFVVIYRTLVEEIDRKTGDEARFRKQAELTALSTLAQITLALWESNKETARDASPARYEKQQWEGYAKVRYEELIRIRARLAEQVSLEDVGTSTPAKQ